MATPTDPVDLATAATCFSCLTQEQREAVKTYLLAVIAGGSLDPAVLSEAARCFVCIPNQKAMQNYLLCQILNL